MSKKRSIQYESEQVVDLRKGALLPTRCNRCHLLSVTLNKGKCALCVSGKTLQKCHGCYHHDEEKSTHNSLFDETLRDFHGLGETLSDFHTLVKSNDFAALKARASQQDFVACVMENNCRALELANGKAFRFMASKLDAQVLTRFLPRMCFLGHRQHVNFLLDHDAQIDDSCLVWATLGGDIETIMYLLEKDLSPSAHEFHAFLIACEAGNSQAVSLMCDSIDGDALKEVGCKGLALACGRGHLNVVKALINNVYPTQLMSKCALIYSKDDPLYEAVVGGQDEVLRFVSKYSWAKHRQDLLPLACKGSNWRIVESILRATKLRLDYAPSKEQPTKKRKAEAGAEPPAKKPKTDSLEAESPAKDKSEPLKMKTVKEMHTRVVDPKHKQIEVSPRFFRAACDQDEMRAIRIFIRRGVALDPTKKGYGLTCKNIGVQTEVYLARKLKAEQE